MEIRDNRDKRFNFRPTSVDCFPNPKGYCRFCGKPAEKGRSRYCSEKCSYELAIRTNPGFARDQVFQRDKGICALCGIDTKKIERGVIGRYDATHTWECDHIIPVKEGGGGCGMDNLRTLCIKCHGKESGKLRKRLNKNK